MSQKPKLIIFSSGSGTTFEYIAQQPLFEVTALICNRSQAKVIQKAHSLGISCQIFSRNQYSSFQLWDQAMADFLKTKNMDLAVLAGFTSLIGSCVLSVCQNRIINIHPSLLPKFGGKGMHGLHVHQAVIDAKESVTGSTIHYVNEQFDSGTVIAQKEVPVFKNDTAETLQERVKQVEKSFLLFVLKQLFGKECKKESDDMDR